MQMSVQTEIKDLVADLDGVVAAPYSRNELNNRNERRQLSIPEIFRQPAWYRYDEDGEGVEDAYEQDMGCQESHSRFREG